MLKSKGGAKPLVRNYTGNKFIVEEDFADRVGQSKDNLYVYFISLQQQADTYNISNNIFDVYELRFPASSMQISNFTFIGNTVKAKKVSGNLVIIKVSDSYDVDSIDISSNTIDLGSIADQPFRLIMMINANSAYAGSIKRISVTNNKITLSPPGYN